jgi:hypothetical protein
MSTAARRTAFIPPLRNGDTLSVREFERRYEAMPEKTKAELIELDWFLLRAGKCRPLKPNADVSIRARSSPASGSTRTRSCAAI